MSIEKDLAENYGETINSEEREEEKIEILETMIETCNSVLSTLYDKRNYKKPWNEED